MANKGDHINFDSGNQGNIKGFSKDSGDKWFAESGANKTYYLYVSGISSCIWLQTDWNLFGTPEFDLWGEYWDGSKWVSVGKINVKGARSTFVTYRSTHIIRYKYKSIGGQFLEYLYGGLMINGYSIDPYDPIPESWFPANQPKPPLGSQTDYKANTKGGRIARVANGNQYYGGKCHTDYKPYDDPVADIYDTTAFRGSPITASVPVCCFVQATGRNDY